MSNAKVVLPDVKSALEDTYDNDVLLSALATVPASIPIAVNDKIFFIIIFPISIN
jgi:hypothetical protein